MGVCSLMGIDKFYGILAGAVALMGGLGTSAAFGPFFEQNYGVTGATTVAITAATFGMATALIIGGPFGEKLIKKYKLKPLKPLKRMLRWKKLTKRKPPLPAKTSFPHRRLLRKF